VRCGWQTRCARNEWQKHCRSERASEKAEKQSGERHGLTPVFRSLPMPFYVIPRKATLARHQHCMGRANSPCRSMPLIKRGIIFDGRGPQAAHDACYPTDPRYSLASPAHLKKTPTRMGWRSARSVAVYQNWFMVLSLPAAFSAASPLKYSL
jgi:hypothetical protein